MPTPRIDFIVVGAQKAGTTALHEYLASDPNYAVSKTKELHFFDDETCDWSAPDYARYHAQFDWDRPAIRGETTPIYLYWPQSLERIAAYRPDIRLVAMLRDPVERAWSHWKMERSRGVETGDFSWCIREGRRRLFACQIRYPHRIPTASPAGRRQQLDRRTDRRGDHPGCRRRRHFDQTRNRQHLAGLRFSAD